MTLNITKDDKPMTNALRLAQCEMQLEDAKSKIALLTEHLEWYAEDVRFVKNAFNELMENERTIRSE